MTTYGLTPTGFTLKPQSQIRTEIENDLLGSIDPALDLSSGNPMGQLVGVMSTKLAECWELLQALYSSTDRGATQGFLLDALGELIGRRREAATYSTVDVSFTLSSGDTVPQGFQLQVAGQPSNVWQLTTAVANTGATGATFTGTWQALQKGPVAANAATLTVIPVPMAGFTGPSNANDASLGRNVETDTQYRLGQAQSEESNGSTTVDALRSALYNLLATENVQGGSITVLENTTLVATASGPAKSFQAIVFDGITPGLADNDIAQTVWENKPAGMQAYGTSSGTATDTLGGSQTVAFTRPTQIPIYIHVSILRGPKYVGGSSGATETAILAALVAAASAAAVVGGVVSPTTLASYIYNAVSDPNDPSVVGKVVEDITALTISTDNITFVSTRITMTNTEIATFLSSNVTVTYV